MKSLIYTIYREGGAGFSNLVMSLELGVVLAGLTGRLLVLKGNAAPVANIVQYGGLVTNAYRSRVTDLIEPGLPWTNAENFNLAGHVPQAVSDKQAFDSVFYFPAHLETGTADFRAFKAKRKHAFTIGEELGHIPALAYSGGPNGDTLGFYSSFFYLDQPSQARTFDILRNIRPRPEYEAFAKRVADGLGRFNAAHVRRGDFKQTYGVTTLDRTASDVLSAIEQHFSRSKRLVLLTDEASDPCFDKIRAAYRDLVFIDHHILENHSREFMDLPAHDSIALAYLSQLVASQSADFIGTMTSTFTALIQRMRANRGKPEPFKFLWNELPEPGAAVERGRHAINNSIPLDRGVMIEQRAGAYSWNRFDERLNPAWMREWPESFLDEAAMLERTTGRPYAVSANAGSTGGGRVMISFQGKTVAASSNRADVTDAIRKLFTLMEAAPDAAAIGEVRIAQDGALARLLVDGKEVSRSADSFRLLRHLYREVVRKFILENMDLVWIHAGCSASRDGAVILPGLWGRGKSTLVQGLYKNDWLFLSDDVAPINPRTGMAIPFPGTPQIRELSERVLRRDEIGSLSKLAVPIDPQRVGAGGVPVTGIIFPHFTPGAKTRFETVPPAQAVGELLENCLSFVNNTDMTVAALCALVENLPAYRLVFSDSRDAAQCIVDQQGAAAGQTALAAKMSVKASNGRR